MNRITWLTCYALVVAGYLAGMQLEHSVLMIVCKVLLMPVLALYFVTSQPSGIIAPGKLVIGGLFFSWVGDTLLLFQAKDDLFFLGGLSAFLLAHVFYILYFRALLKARQVQLSWIVLLPVAVYYGVLMIVLFPHLGTMQGPVVVYGLVISTMLFLALQTVRAVKGGPLMAAGALLFVASDSILAFNRFYQPFAMAGLLIMLTYVVAQSWITEGALVQAASKK